MLRKVAVAEIGRHGNQPLPGRRTRGRKGLCRQARRRGAGCVEALARRGRRRDQVLPPVPAHADRKKRPSDAPDGRRRRRAGRCARRKVLLKALTIPARSSTTPAQDCRCGEVVGGRGPVAQWIEQQPSKLKVEGSSPSGVANPISGLSEVERAVAQRRRHMPAGHQPHQAAGGIGKAGRRITVRPQSSRRFGEAGHRVNRRFALTYAV